ncbi:unnamed protein product [Protopolystoma xenopodis]|uniref:Uncharacterized protein n=1 Tax=Protopolystoma xenopodis TaxID=117903 RepID=A0A3S5A388_9PLAT|nr:unnamed protein product [Protopolystoma xenopodis]
MLSMLWCCRYILNGRPSLHKMVHEGQLHFPVTTRLFVVAATGNNTNHNDVDDTDGNNIWAPLKRASGHLWDMILQTSIGLHHFTSHTHTHKHKHSYTHTHTHTLLHTHACRQ